MALHRIFVYGTLKRGHPNYSRFLDPAAKYMYGVAEFVGVAKLVNKYPLVIASRYNIPFLLSAEGKGEVRLCVVVKYILYTSTLNECICAFLESLCVSCETCGLPNCTIPRT